jgi:ABC-2 type transport system ATP-binding protein
MPPILRTDGLTKTYGRVLALDHLCLEVDEGEVVGFLGPNGAGKTTTIRLLLDLIRPTAGTARIGGFDCHRQSLDARKLVGYLPGEMPVYPEMTGRAYLDYLGRLGGAASSPARLDGLVRRFDVGPAQLERPIRDLSHGTRRKLGIVQALMGEPRLAILDEPTSGLDPLMIEAFAEAVSDLRREGRTAVFLSSHVLSEVEKTCDRVAVIRDGRLMAVRTIAELARSLPRRVVVRLAPGAAGDPPPAVAGVRVVAAADRSWEFEVAGPLGPLVERLAGMGVADLEVRAPTLEDYVLGLYRGES